MVISPTIILMGIFDYNWFFEKYEYDFPKFFKNITLKVSSKSFYEHRDSLNRSFGYSAQN